MLEPRSAIAAAEPRRSWIRGRSNPVIVTTSRSTPPAIPQVYPQGPRGNEGGRLQIGGCDALELVREFGSPLYAVAEDDLRGQARSFTQALAGRHRDGEVLFGSKAFPCSAVYRVLA